MAIKPRRIGRQVAGLGAAMLATERTLDEKKSDVDCVNACIFIQSKPQYVFFLQKHLNIN